MEKNGSEKFLEYQYIVSKNKNFIKKFVFKFLIKNFFICFN
jgi:hypothetical protein